LPFQLGIAGQVDVILEHSLYTGLIFASAVDIGSGALDEFK
jgi:hypothetical protein